MATVFSNTTYRDVFQASDIFHHDYVAYDDPWLDTMRAIDWNKVHEMDTDTISTRIIGFLNKWKCRLPYSEVLAEGIREKFVENTSIIQALKDESIEQYQSKKELDIDGEQVYLETAFYDLMRSFTALPFNFSTVAATKLLHFPLPRLVVMWDTPISERYLITRTPRNYITRFIPLMHIFSQKLIKEYSKDNNCDTDYAIWDINRKFYPRTMAKIIDEYNYITITRGISVNTDVKAPDSKLKVGVIIKIRAIKGRDGRVISRAEDGRIILFDEADPNSVTIKVGDIFDIKIIRSESNFIIARKFIRGSEVSPTGPDPPDEPVSPIKDVKELFCEFQKYSNFVAGEGIHEKSIETWMKERRQAKEYYMEKFSSENIDELTEDDLKSFLYFKNNRAWTMLYRQGGWLIKNFQESKRNISHLQDENEAIETRINNVMLGGKLWTRGFGKNITTGILHTCDSRDKYGVWNNRVEDCLKILNKPIKIHYKDFGLSYNRINSVLNKLKQELNTDLVMLDGFMWYVSKLNTE